MGWLTDERSDESLEELEKRTAWPMLVLAILAAAMLVIELVVPDLAPSTVQRLDAVDLVITIVFALEYLLRLRLAEDRGRFAKTHLFDLVVILPVFQPLRILRSVRILRTMRVARTAALVGKGVQESRHVYKLRDIPRVLVVSGLIVVAAAALTYGIERQEPSASIATFPDALWWAVTTASTVGSTFEPITPEGRVIAVGLMVLGISVVTAMAGIFASDFVHRRQEGSASGESAQ